MAVLASIGSGLVANYLYDVGKRSLPAKIQEYVPALYNSDPAYLREAEKHLQEAIGDIRDKYKTSKTIQIFLSPEKLRRDGVLSPVLDYLLNSGPNPEEQIRKSLATCIVGGEFPISRGTQSPEFGRIVREITRTVEQKFLRSERLVGFLSNSSLNHLAAKVESIHDLVLKKTEAERQGQSNDFFVHYLRDLRDVSKNLKLHGVEKVTSQGTLSQDLSATYIEIEATCPGNGKHKSKSFLAPHRTRFSTAQLLEDLPKAILKGPAGSGKTTVLQKMILDADFDGFSGTLPIYIPLRRLERGYSQDWSIEAAFQLAVRNPLIQANIPIDIVEQLKSLGGNVIFLLDGLDELSENTRTKLWQLVEDIESRLKSARIVLTTRPLANVHHSDGTVKESIYSSRVTFSRARLQWRPNAGFFEFTIGDLTNTQISVFVDRWFDGVDQETRTLAGQDENWENLPHRLKALLFSAPQEETLKLARSPLICSLVCLIFFLRDGALPSSRRQLYEMATQLLIEVRDAARDVRVDPKFDVIDRERRESLLQSIALEMQEGDTGTESQNIEIRRKSVEEITRKWLDDNRFPEIGETELLDMLLERCAIIREPSAGMIDFVHRSFMEFLAANEIVLKRGPHSVRSKIENEQWVATLSFAMNTPQGGVFFGGALITELVDYVRQKYSKSQQRHIRRSLGYRIAGLLDHRADYPTSNHGAIRDLCEIILPPSSMSEAYDCREIPISFLGETIDFDSASKISDGAVKASGYLLAQHEDQRSSEFLNSGFQKHGDVELISAINYSGRVPFSQHTAMLKRISNGSYRRKLYLSADELQEKKLRIALGQDVGIRFPFTGKDFIGWDVLRKARDVTLIGPVRSDWDAMLSGGTQKFKNCGTLEIIGGADFNFNDISTLFPRSRIIILEDCRHFSAEGLQKLRFPEEIEFRRISYPISLDFTQVSTTLEAVTFLSCAEVNYNESSDRSIKIEYGTL